MLELWDALLGWRSRALAAEAAFNRLEYKLLSDNARNAPDTVKQST